MNKLNIHIPDPEPKETFSLKLRPNIKQLLVELCKKTKVPQEEVLKAGIFFVQKEYEKKLKEAANKNYNSEKQTCKRKILNPYPKLVKRVKKQIKENINNL